MTNPVFSHPNVAFKTTARQRAHYYPLIISDGEATNRQERATGHYSVTAALIDSDTYDSPTPIGGDLLHRSYALIDRA